MKVVGASAELVQILWLMRWWVLLVSHVLCALAAYRAAGAWTAPIAMIALQATLHRLLPSRSAMKFALRDRATKPYYRDEGEAERSDGYCRHHMETCHQLTPFCLIVPSSRASETALVWVPGLGRYFSHTGCNRDFKGADLCGLDLPKYGRVLHWDGLDEEGNEINSVPVPSDGSSLVSYYYPVYTGACHELLRRGYTRVILMANSTAGLTLQCYLNHDCEKCDNLAGVILTSPFWSPKLPVLKLARPWVFRTLSWVFPKLMLAVDPSGGPGWVEPLIEAAIASGRRGVGIDPELNPVDNKPVYVEWAWMVAQAQQLMRAAKQLPRVTERLHRVPALLLTTDDPDMDPHVDIDDVHRIWDGIYGASADASALRVPRGQHEIMLSELAAYEFACDAINRFIARCNAGKQ